MIILNLADKTIELNVHEVEGKTLYKAQDLLKGYGLSVQQTKDKVQNWKESISKKCGVKFTPYSIQRGTMAGTYLTKREILKLAGYVDYHFEDAVYEAFEALSEGRVNTAEEIAKSVLQIRIEKAIENNNKGIQTGKQISKALQESMANPKEMIETLKAISYGIKTVKADGGREGFWKRSRSIVANLREEYRATAKKFDIQTYGQYEEVLHYCSKRIAQSRDLHWTKDVDYLFENAYGYRG